MSLFEHVQRTRLTDKHTHDLLHAYANGRVVKQLSQPLGPLELAQPGIFDRHVPEIDTDNACDHVDGMPEGVDVLGLDWYRQ